MKNPFVISGYNSPENFCDRQQETERLRNAALSSLSTALISIRRMGKTGLILNVINSLKKENVRCIYFDIMMTNSLQDFVYQFGKAFYNQAASLPEKILKSAGSLMMSFAASLVPDPMTGNFSVELKLTNPARIEDDLDRILDYIKKSRDRYLIAIDEFQQITRYSEKYMEGLLRSKFQFIDNAAFIYSGSEKHLLNSMFGEHSRPFWQSCSFLELKPIDKNVYSQFITDKFKAHNRIISNETLDYIFDITRGITFYIQLICNYLFNSGIRTIENINAYHTLNNIISERESYFIHFAKLLPPRNLELLSAIACEGKIDKPTAKEFLMKYHLGAASTVRSALDSLIDKEAVYHERGYYLITDPFFAEWLKNNGMIW
ncbi:MAG: ATPase 2 protein [Bacteroidota bacterium]|nr:ATPase 2 protein [Bacteroidota bacterium]